MLRTIFEDAGARRQHVEVPQIRAVEATEEERRKSDVELDTDGEEEGASGSFEKANCSFTAKHEERLVEFFAAHQVFYDKSHPNYMNQQHKDRPYLWHLCDIQLLLRSLLCFLRHFERNCFCLFVVSAFILEITSSTRAVPAEQVPFTRVQRTHWATDIGKRTDYILITCAARTCSVHCRTSSVRCR